MSSVHEQVYSDGTEETGCNKYLLCPFKSTQDERGLPDLLIDVFVPKCDLFGKRHPVMGDKRQIDHSYIVGFPSHELIPVLIC